MKSLRSILKNQKGQSAVEFALILPVLLALICGMVDFGWIMGNRLLISYCAREGARYGIVTAADSNSDNMITQRVLDTAPAYIRNGLNVSISYSDPADKRDGDITVIVTYNLNVLTPVGGIFTRGQTVSLNAQTVMKVE